jgi:hypothetical protein
MGLGVSEEAHVKPVRALAYRYGRWNRQRKARFAVEFGERLGARSLLLVGVDSERNEVNNIVEHQLSAHFADVVASGMSSGVEGWPRYVVADGRRLPFADAAFDLVYANAVIEHVGDRDDQIRFARELARVGVAWVITTPNRWFPIEAHYHTFFTHWGRGWAPRGSVSRLLGRRDLQRLLPDGHVLGLPVLSPTLTAISGRPSRGLRRASPRQRSVV